MYLIKPNHRSADIALLLLYIAVCAVILFRVNIEATGYLSPDSESYLQLAQNLKDGNSFYLYNEDTAEESFFSIWPVGYPVLIYFVSAVTSLPVFWASKVLNLLLVGWGFLLLRNINREYSYILASVYCAYTLLEVYSFTWSEAPFLLGLLCLCYLVRKILLESGTAKSILFLFLVCIFLFLMRYVGAFSFSVPVLLACFFYYKKRRRKAAILLAVSFLLASCAGLYLCMNYALSGFAVGIVRLEAVTEPARTFLGMLTEGLLNELLIIRKYRQDNQPDYLFYLTTTLQITVMAIIVVKAKKCNSMWDKFKENLFSCVCIFTAALYFAGILLLRSLSPFGDLDYRFLAPFSFLFWMGIVNLLISLPDNNRSTTQAKYAAFAFFIISLLLNLPKQYIVKSIDQLLP